MRVWRFVLNSIKFTSSQIRYVIWILRLTRGECGVKNGELASALGYSRPSVHNMLKSLADMGVVTQEAFGLAHLTNAGCALAREYAACFALVEQAMNGLCGKNVITEITICGILADLPRERIRALCKTAQ